ncbi:MAG: D-glycero-beta-D-manno-heptose 1-phosphate adenylyltransferase [Phycisphaerales bacterium]|nr:D-glycero-beta-D-manno-heptose 1-phosphate adenylyltransferase [Phycisphaerales bacterium]
MTRTIDLITNRKCTLIEAQRLVNGWHALGHTVVFTNGCFDVIHEGHIHSLLEAAKQGDHLIVGLNSDASIKRLKGDHRPINNESARSTVLSALIMVDIVILFEEDTPINLIKAFKPNVLVKGGDYTLDSIVGAKEVQMHGGRVFTHSLLEGRSTTNIINKISQQKS